MPKLRHRPPRTAIIGLLLLSLAGGPAGAQEPPAEGVAAAPPEVVPPEHASARSTLKTFLGSFYATSEELGEEPLARAAGCLDLSALPENLRSTRGPELAAELKAILDRTERIDLDSVPDDPDGAPYRIQVHKLGAVTVAPNAAGEWRFTTETVARIPELYRATEGFKVVEGVEEAPRTLSMWLRSLVPASLRRVGFLLEHWQWLALLLLAFVGVVLDKVVATALQVAVGRYLGRHLERLPADGLRSSLRPLGLVAAALVWWSGIHALGLSTDVLEVLVVAVKFVAATAVVWAAYRTVDVVSSLLQARAERTANKYDDLLVPLVRKSLKVFIAAFGVVFIADNLDVDITSLLTGLGLGGIAVALAAQDTVKNLFGSLMVIVDQPFHVGDWVVIEGVEGNVAEVGFRSTRIRTFYNSLVTLPNAKLMTASIDNYGARRYRRWKTMLSLTYGTPPEKIEAFCEGIRELIRRHPYTRKDYFHVYLNQFAAASLDVLLYVFFETPDWSTELRERQRLGLDILRLARDLGVDFAFPTQTLYLHRPEPPGPPEPPDGYAERLDRAHAEARQHAGRLVDTALAGEVPPPVGAAEVQPGESEGAG